MNRLYIILLLIILVYTGSAQKMGFKVGLNVSNLAGENSGFSSKAGINVGFFWLFKLSEKVRFMPEVVYSSQGAQISSQSSKTNYDYINIPLMFNIHPNNKNFFFQLGPQFGILTSAETGNSYGSHNITSQINPTDFSLAFGLGSEFKKVLINARYSAGLTNTNKSSGNYQSNSVFQFSMGFKL